MTVSIKSPTSTTGSIQLNGSDVLTIDSSGNLTAPNALTVTGTSTLTGNATVTGTLTVNSTASINGSNISTQPSFRNLIINGDMRIAQRGTSFTADNVYTLDRWKSADGTGGTPARTLSQQTFTLGQTDVPNAYYYLQHNQTGASTNGNASLVQRIEDVTQFDGQTITISFYAKADASMNINIRLLQDFGTGGSPSAAVEVSEIVSIGTSWTKYTVTKTLGSLSGKTLGTDGVNTSYLTVNIDFQPTTTFVFDVTLFQLELGTEATPFENLPYDVELAMCQRYYFKVGPSSAGDRVAIGYAALSTLSDVLFVFPVTMRDAPTALEQTGTASDYGVQRAAGQLTCSAVPVFTTATKNQAAIRQTVSSGLTTGEGTAARLQTTSAYYAWSAEL
jgi:hypothetical protein